MEIRCFWEHHGDDTLLHALDYPGAFTRGESLEIALGKMAAEVRSYLAWVGKDCPTELVPVVTLEQTSDLAICDADSDVLFPAERRPLTRVEYFEQKALVLKSAADFQRLYDSIPDKSHSARPTRTTFYGPVPRTAQEMYEHTKNVNDYYFGEIGVQTDHGGSIVDCRVRGFAVLERQGEFLQCPVWIGSYGEAWTLRKVLRRFLWHDRIHAKAMYRAALNGSVVTVENVFHFPNEKA